MSLRIALRESPPPFGPSFILPCTPAGNDDFVPIESAIVINQPEGAVGSAAYPDSAREEVQLHWNGGNLRHAGTDVWVIDSQASALEQRVSPDSVRP